MGTKFPYGVPIVPLYTTVTAYLQSSSVNTTHWGHLSYSPRKYRHVQSCADCIMKLYAYLKV